MKHYIDKSAVSELKNLYEDIDKCIADLVLARSKHDQRGISDAHWKMETLMVNTQQVLSYILQHLEVKEVDLEKEMENLIEKEKAFVTDNREVKYYNGDSFNHIYELEFIAKHFFELGLKAQREE